MHITKKRAHRRELLIDDNLVIPGLRGTGRRLGENNISVFDDGKRNIIVSEEMSAELGTEVKFSRFLGQPFLQRFEHRNRFFRRVEPCEPHSHAIFDVEVPCCDLLLADRIGSTNAAKDLAPWDYKVQKRALTFLAYSKPLCS